MFKEKSIFLGQYLICLYVLIVSTYLLNLLYIILLNRIKNLVFFAYIQIVFDLVFVTAIIYITGRYRKHLFFSFYPFDY